MNVYSPARVGILGERGLPCEPFPLTTTQRDQLETTTAGYLRCRCFSPDLGSLGSRRRATDCGDRAPAPRLSPSVYQWLAAYRATRDPGSLADHRGGNHPTLWTAELRALLAASLTGAPDHWDTPRWSGLFPCSKSIWLATAAFAPAPRRSAKNCTGRITPGNDRAACSTRIASERKKTANSGTNQAAGAHWVKLFEDETDLLLFPPLRAAWGRRGQPLAVPISGRNARRVVFGSLNIDTGQRLFLARQRQRSEDFRAFLTVVARHYRGRSVALLLDEDPSHLAQPSLALAAALGMRLLWLPKRSPALNGMDHLWGHGRTTCAPIGSMTTLMPRPSGSSLICKTFRTKRRSGRRGCSRPTSG